MKKKETKNAVVATRTGILDSENESTVRSSFNKGDKVKITLITGAKHPWAFNTPEGLGLLLKSKGHIGKVFVTKGEFDDDIVESFKESHGIKVLSKRSETRIHKILKTVTEASQRDFASVN